MHISTHRVYLLLVSLFFAHIVKPTQSTSATQQPWLTIFVHGIISVKPFLSPYNFMIIMQDAIENSVYAHAIEHARNDSFFHQYHPMQDLGLQKIDMELVQEGAASTAFARTYDYLTKQINKSSSDIYYTYGWSAVLSQKRWLTEGQLFYKTLQDTLTDYHAQGIYPKIRIIGYSHGGSIALNLPYAKSKNCTLPTVQIDELILIGMPVISQAIDELSDPMFKKVYHIYSHGDRVQTADIFSLNIIFGNRAFTHSHAKPLPDKLHQIGVRMYRRSSRCLKHCTIEHHDHIAPPRHIRKADPGHTELWSFGWVGSSYRDYQPLYPLPLAAFIPWLRDIAHTHAQTSKHISLTLHPYCNKTCVYLHDVNKTTHCPFIAHDTLRYLQQDALQFYPKDFTLRSYDQHVKLANRKAHKSIKALRINKIPYVQ